jgi:hypothetical protein
MTRSGQIPILAVLYKVIKAQAKQNSKVAPIIDFGYIKYKNLDTEFSTWDI